ncbi:hypothetical protein A0256_17715 [Mucilaginibacter sp. PAMC 26640]|nr:hypothetical protein A0256_17715 [Mucilaginibacter sp. PAMC 26640]
MFSCRKKPVYLPVNGSDNSQIQQLIKQGKNLQSAHADSALAIAEKLSKIAEHTHDKTAVVYSELFKAHYLWMSADHQQAMGMAIKALADIDKNKINQAYPQIYSLISNLHKENTNYKKAFESQQNALSWATTNKDTMMIISALSQKAMLTHSIRKVRRDTVRDTSINIQIRALKIAESNSKYERVSIPLYDNVGQYYLDKKDFDKAIYYAGKGAFLARKLNQPRSLTYAYAWLGQAWFFKGEQQKGLDYLNKAIAISREIKEPYREMELYGHLEDCYVAMQDYKTSLNLVLRAQKMRDSLKVRQNEVKMSELEIKYQTATKDKAIAEMGHQQSEKNRQLLIVVAGCVLFIVFTIVLYLQYRLIRKDNRLNIISNVKKDQALQNIAFVQSHEIRKPVASIMGLINVLKANDYEVDKETLSKLQQAGEELDTVIKSIIVHVEEEAMG